MSLIALLVSAPVVGQENKPPVITVLPFTGRDVALAQRLRNGFVEELTRSRCCDPVNRTDYDKVIAARNMESGIVDSLARVELNERSRTPVAQMVLYGEIEDQADSPEIILHVRVLRLDSRELNLHVPIPRRALSHRRERESLRRLVRDLKTTLDPQPAPVSLSDDEGQTPGAFTVTVGGGISRVGKLLTDNAAFDYGQSGFHLSLTSPSLLRIQGNRFVTGFYWSHFEWSAGPVAGGGSRELFQPFAAYRLGREIQSSTPVLTLDILASGAIAVDRHQVVSGSSRRTSVAVTGGPGLAPRLAVPLLKWITIEADGFVVWLYGLGYHSGVGLGGQVH